MVAKQCRAHKWNVRQARDGEGSTFRHFFLHIRNAGKCRKPRPEQAQRQAGLGQAPAGLPGQQQGQKGLGAGEGRLERAPRLGEVELVELEVSRGLVSAEGAKRFGVVIDATGKADAAVGMIHRWLKPLEAGFDVKIIGSSHGGCVRLVGSKAAGVTNLAALKGKTVGVSDLAAPGKHFFTILLAKHGIDPDRDITWRQYPADLLGVAVDKGEIQAIADGDPNLYLLEKRTNGAYVELATNLTGEYARKVCCVIGARGELVRNDRQAASGLARAIVQATDFVNENPNEAAKVFAKYSPKVAVDDLRKLYATLTYTHHPTGVDLRDEIAFYAEDFRRIGVIKKYEPPVTG